MMKYPFKIDLHMHTTVSDGTDAPEAIAERVKEQGIELFSVTDHDDIKGCSAVSAVLADGDPLFIHGVEFSCRDAEGRYHILGYRYDPEGESIRGAVAKGHALRMFKLQKRLEFLEETFGFTFSEEDRKALYALNNPGKPHIGNLMVRYGYAPSKDAAIREYLDKCRGEDAFLRPEEAIEAILASGGIPVLAHPSFGKGDERIVGDDMDRRLRRLIGFGLQGVEAFYSGFTPELINEMLSFAEKYSLYVTAGSDYHGKNKQVRLGHTNLSRPEDCPEGLFRFFDAVL